MAKKGVLALCSGVSVYLYHARYSQGKLLALHKEDAQILSTEYCPPSNRPDGRAKVPQTSAKDGPLVLQLQQVQIIFRHGPRTPLHTTPNLSEAVYDNDLLIRGHQESMFPYIRISYLGEPIQGWSNLETNLWKKPLRGGALSGQLTGYGKEQMYMLGLQLKDIYTKRLDIATYDADEVRVMSSNVRRTVESAQSLLAGMFGKEQLIDYAQCCGPVRIYTPDPCYNILVPNTETCAVLRKSNQSAMVNPDFIPGFKDQRLEVEEHIMKRREKLLEAITEVQSRLDATSAFYESEGPRTRYREINKHRDHYLHDPHMQPLYDERAQAIEKLDRFWANVLTREPALQDIITTGDMRALVYLRNLRVEQFEGTVASGYRIHLYFDENPFFHNTHLCKVVYTNENSPILSRETPIKWKGDMQKLVQEGLFQDEEEDSTLKEKMECEDKTPKCARQFSPKTEEPPQKSEQEVIGEDSFFSWFSTPTSCDSDTVGSAIMGDLWKNPLAVMENDPKVHDPWDKKLNFVYSYDDATSRAVHGWWYPSQLRRYRDMIESNAATTIHYSMTGQNPEARKIITRLSAGPLLTEMIDTARRMMCGEKMPKLCLYATHDSELVALLEAMCLWDHKWPSFCADLRLELYRELDGCDFYVRVLYNGKEQRVRGQTESYMLWGDFCNAMRKLTIRREEMERICRSNILERIAQEILRQCKKEKETEETKAISNTPCGM
ncbi:protein SET [Elysia marginata]|uniref:2-phosphoxylose phosphatase 1 n=1 Tax=Elysia marginata TaxID=1093978 RepID=A0AAV4I4B6_9GAST|nr:protein SET [Elysia marginata]